MKPSLCFALTAFGCGVGAGGGVDIGDGAGAGVGVDIGEGSGAGVGCGVMVREMICVVLPPRSSVTVTVKESLPLKLALGL